MQYILSEKEFNSGCELIESFRDYDNKIEDAYKKSKSLNEQGYFTVIVGHNNNPEIFDIIVYQKNN